MTTIVIDFLERRWLAYALCVLGGLGVLQLDAGYGVYLLALAMMLPFGSEYTRGKTMAIMILPLSREEIVLSNWFITALAPTILVAGTIFLNAAFFQFFISPKDLVLNIFASLIWTSSIFGWFTYRRCAVFTGIALTWILISLTGILKGPVPYLTALVAVALTIRSYTGPKTLLSRSFGESGRQARRRLEIAQPPLARGPGRFTPLILVGARNSFLGASIFISAMLLSDFRPLDNSFRSYVFAFSVLGTAAILGSGTRLARLLPLSTNQLAGVLLLFPIANMVAISAAIFLSRHLYHTQFPFPFGVALLIPITGGVCLVSSLKIRLGAVPIRGALPVFASLAAEAIISVFSISHQPTAFWWILGLCLVAAAFFLNRYWLRSSLSYRIPVGS